MNRESATVVEDVKTEAAEGLDPAAWRRGGSVTPDLSGATNNAHQSGGKRTLGERIKSFFAKLEGDHDYHNYLGG